MTTALVRRDRPADLRGGSAQRTDLPARWGLGTSTEATWTAGARRSLGPQGRTMTVGADVPYTWPNAIVDLGPIELRAGHWGLVGLIPYDGHVVLAVSPAPPTWDGAGS